MVISKQLSPEIWIRGINQGQKLTRKIPHVPVVPDLPPELTSKSGLQGKLACSATLRVVV